VRDEDDDDGGLPNTNGSLIKEATARISSDAHLFGF
jgi:hypothetical protein